jgi:hypothetical protein
MNVGATSVYEGKSALAPLRRAGHSFNVIVLAVGAPSLQTCAPRVSPPTRSLSTLGREVEHMWFWAFVYGGWGVAEWVYIWSPVKQY